MDRYFHSVSQMFLNLDRESHLHMMPSFINLDPAREAMAALYIMERAVIDDNAEDSRSTSISKDMYVNRIGELFIDQDGKTSNLCNLLSQKDQQAVAHNILLNLLKNMFLTTLNQQAVQRLSYSLFILQPRSVYDVQVDKNLEIIEIFNIFQYRFILENDFETTLFKILPDFEKGLICYFLFETAFNTNNEIKTLNMARRFVDFLTGEESSMAKALTDMHKLRVYYKTLLLVAQEAERSPSFYPTVYIINKVGPLLQQPQKNDPEHALFDLLIDISKAYTIMTIAHAACYQHALDECPNHRKLLEQIISVDGQTTPLFDALPDAKKALAVYYR
ncbi:MAG: hypothetical protein LBB29_03425 [Holosporaceae bacterium]|nr:hypothetical protein [Holosporaceae bacterium]